MSESFSKKKGEWECEVEKLVDLQWKQRIYSDPKLSPYLEQINRA